MLLLDMKWGNRDISFVESVNTPKLCKIADIVTLELLFDDVLVDICFGYIKWYSQREKAGISFEITNEKDWFFWNTLLLSEYHKLLNLKMYWETTPILWCIQGLV